MSLRNFKITIEYDGTDFKGWQTQHSSQRTVQNEISLTLQRILKHPVTVIGSGRTDTGVHAAGQVAHFKTTAKISGLSLLKALNAYLPEDIAIKKIEEVPLDFHAQYDALSKTYRYTIYRHPVRSVSNRRTALFHPYDLDLKLLKREARHFIGRHDFKFFQSADPQQKRMAKKRQTIRTVKTITIKEAGPQITIDIEADGFLYRMIRNIVPVLLDVGSKRLPPGTVKNILTGKLKRRSLTAQPQGLSLLKVKY